MEKAAIPCLIIMSCTNIDAFKVLKSFLLKTVVEQLFANVFIHFSPMMKSETQCF